MNQAVCDHIPLCDGSMKCVKCGRPGCSGCIFTEADGNTLGIPNLIGLCVLCAGTYKKEFIILHDAPHKEWDKAEN